MSLSVQLGLQSPLLNSLPGLSHLFSSREGGVSEGPFASLNLKYPVVAGDESGGAERVHQNRERVCGFLGLQAWATVACQQVHGAYVHNVTAEDVGRGALTHDSGIVDCDGLISACQGVPLLVMVADCVPVLLADPVKRVVGAVHSGWRGTQQQIARVALQQMQSLYGSDPRDIRLAIGPGIGFESFEVGPEVVEAFSQQVDLDNPQILKQVGEKYRLNLAEIIRLQALDEGLPAEQIDLTLADTLTDSRFFSYRRENGVTGRQGGWIGWR